jgi:hypothetical protein
VKRFTPRPKNKNAKKQKPGAQSTAGLDYLSLSVIWAGGCTPAMAAGMTEKL